MLEILDIESRLMMGEISCDLVTRCYRLYIPSRRIFCALYEDKKKCLILLNVLLYIRGGSFDNYVCGMMIDRRCREAAQKKHKQFYLQYRKCAQSVDRVISLSDPRVVAGGLRTSICKQYCLPSQFVTPN